MKRSMVIEKISNILRDFRKWGSHDIDECADLILNMVEDLGMRPSKYTGLMANGKRYDPTTDGGRDVIDFQSWEPEDQS